jgi:hypothetical protein
MHALILHAMHTLNVLTILLCTGYYLIIFVTTCCFSHHNLSFDLSLTPVVRYIVLGGNLELIDFHSRLVISTWTINQTYRLE